MPTYLSRLLAGLVVLTSLWSARGDAATYYVGKTGNDGRACSPTAQNSATPRLTINGGIACLNSGDTLVVMAGTYIEAVYLTSHNGSSGAPTIIKANPGDTVIIQPDADAIATAGPPQTSAWYFDGSSYIILDGLIFDMRDTPQTSAGYSSSVGISMRNSANHLTIQNVEVKNFLGDGSANGDGIQGCAYCNNLLFDHVKIHDLNMNCSTATGYGSYGMYLRGQDIIVQYSEIYNTCAYGIHIYSGENVNERITIRNNIIRNTAYHEGRPLIVGTVNDALVYNNLIYNNYHGPTIEIGFGGSGSGIYNNTLYGNTNTCMWVWATSTTIQNNICYSAGAGVDAITDDSGGTAMINANLLGTNPHFVNAAGSDFHLQSDSVARVANGASTVVLSSIFTTDYDGVLRGWDLGALAYGTAIPAPTNLRFVTLP